MRKANLLALSALCVVLKKTLLVFEELIKEAMLLVMVIAQVDRCVALDSLTRQRELQQDSNARGEMVRATRVVRQRSKGLAPAAKHKHSQKFQRTERLVSDKAVRSQLGTSSRPWGLNKETCRAAPC